MNLVSGGNEDMKEEWEQSCPSCGAKPTFVTLVSVFGQRKDGSYVENSFSKCEKCSHVWNEKVKTRAD